MILYMVKTLFESKTVMFKIIVFWKCNKKPLGSGPKIRVSKLTYRYFFWPDTSSKHRYPYHDNRETLTSITPERNDVMEQSVMSYALLFLTLKYAKEVLKFVVLQLSWKKYEW